MRNKARLQKIAAVALALLVWQAASMALNQSLLLASPLGVLRRLGTIWLEKTFWHTVAFSFSRIVAGFLLAFLLGAALGVLSSRFHALEIFLWPYVTVAKSVPVASFIIIALIFLSSSQLSVFISFLMVFPILYSNILQGMKSTDPKLLEMARLFRVPWGRRLLYIYLPQLKPFVLSACSVALGVSWKAGVAAEVIGIPTGSIGEVLYQAKIYFNTADLFAWTVVIVLVSVGFEKLFLWLLKRGFSALERR